MATQPSLVKPRGFSRTLKRIRKYWFCYVMLLGTFFLLITNISYAFFDTFASVSILTGGNRNTNTNTDRKSVV